MINHNSLNCEWDLAGVSHLCALKASEAGSKDVTEFSLA